MNRLSKISAVFAAACMLSGVAAAKELNAVGITLGTLGNPFFVAISKGAEAKARQINPKVRFTSASADYDLNKQVSQIENFVSAGVDLILINAVDPKAIAPAIERAKKAGIVVVAVDAGADGAEAVVSTDNVRAGELACEFLVKALDGKGNVIIQNGPPVTAVTDRVAGCKNVLGKSKDIKILSSDQDGKGTREGGLNVMLAHLTRFPKIDGVFAINDPQAVGSDLAAKQLGRKGITIVSVDGAPDIEQALQSDTLVQASASQDPWAMAQKAVEVGAGLLDGKKPASPTVLLDPKLVTRENVKSYQGWGAGRK
ncbi:ABC transporter substrate-binding protein [Variovorax sp. ZS18.2.2]|uniref:ABC transporter substrate-binding protein n=1 Tax=Variovorax sp. ZS18.2.2 TaxID=2971255 RepID=UPI002151311D|nr:ABC transporter substrate-binding protein [Variovorax sp. ZS18.2.2]MCR6476923.1 ABC transporter substrate-binding protein [Variovorax sp. ZS18.2.2]